MLSLISDYVTFTALTVGVVDCANCISAKRYDSPWKPTVGPEMQPVMLGDKNFVAEQVD